MNDLQIIILAGGKGLRMNSDLPKVLVKLNGDALVKRLLANLRGFDPSQMVIVTGHKRDLVEQELGPGYIYAFQSEQLGTANAVLSAKSKIFAENVIVLYGDMPFITYSSLARLREVHEKNNSKFTMFTTTVPNFDEKYEAFSNFGRIIRENGQLKKIVEVKYASEGQKNIREVNPGIYMFDTRWLWDNIAKIDKNTQSEYYLTDLLEIAENQGIKVNTETIEPFEVYGINTQEQLKIAEALV